MGGTEEGTRLAERVDIREYFEDLEDPRNGPAQMHELIDIVVIAICAIVCGADHWTEVEAFGQAREAWLRQFLELPHGIPSHDTFSRVFRYLNPAAFESGFRAWTQALHNRTAGEVIPIDGKCLRGSHDRATEKAAIYMVSAWAENNHLVLGQRKVDEKSNEITAIPELLRVLDVKDCIVTIDAMGTQKEISAQIREQEGDYLLALKGNHSHLSEDADSLFKWAKKTDYLGLDHDYHRTINKGHDRIEIRECWTLSGVASLSVLSGQQDWAGLQTVARIRSERRHNGDITSDERFYISSLPYAGQHTATQVLHAARSHWGIENRLHWVLDMAFHEDECRVRLGHGDENLAILRHIALNLLRADKHTRLGVHGKRLKAAWDLDYLSEILGFQMR